MLGVFVLVAGVVSVASLLHTDKVAFRPGSATATAQRIAVDGATTYPPTGDILFLTVAVDRLTWLEWFETKFQDHVAVYDVDKIFGNQSKQESEKVNAQLMSQSKSSAELAALHKLGYTVFDDVGAVVAQDPASDSPSAGRLRLNDVVVAVDGQPITTRDQLVQAIRSRPAGTSVRLRVQRADAPSDERTETVVLGSRRDDQTGATVTVLGVSVETRRVQRDLPVNVTIDSAQVGGNSAGLAFALALIDDLTPGELTGGARVAVTGTIDPDGNVGLVGGIPQKAVAARKAGAVAMLVPRDQLDEAAPNAGGMQLIPVSTLDEAITALEQFGGNGASLARAG